MLDRLLTLRVDFRDDQAAAEITPEQAARYLTAKGWTERIPERSRRDSLKMRIFARVPESERLDYLLSGCADVAAAEDRSPLAVWWEMRHG